jgi:hypothetical protein
MIENRPCFNGFLLDNFPLSVRECELFLKNFEEDEVHGVEMEKNNVDKRMLPGMNIP